MMITRQNAERVLDISGLNEKLFVLSKAQAEKIKVGLSSDFPLPQFGASGGFGRIRGKLRDAIRADESSRVIQALFRDLVRDGFIDSLMEIEFDDDKVLGDWIIEWKDQFLQWSVECPDVKEFMIA